MPRQFLVSANHKCNSPPSTTFNTRSQIIIAPSTLHLLTLHSANKDKNIVYAAQNTYLKSGAFTGELSPEVLTQAGITHTLIGHSERREIFGESNEQVAEKTKACVQAGMTVILCCGEKLPERESGKTMEIVIKQLQAVKDCVQDWSKIIIAYEPVWAIGTGKVATPQQAQETHAEIRQWLNKVGLKGDEIRILYGGSVNGANAAEIAKGADVDGFLVGGASLKPEFQAIIDAGNAQ